MGDSISQGIIEAVTGGALGGAVLGPIGGVVGSARGTVKATKGVMKELAGAPPTPEAPPLPPDPAQDAETQRNMDAAANSERRARGRASTILGGGSRSLDASGSVSRRTLTGY